MSLVERFFAFSDESVSITPNWPPMHLLLMAFISSIPYLLLQLFIIPNFISYPFFKTYRDIVEKEKKEELQWKKDKSTPKKKTIKDSVVWNNYILSTIHAVFAFGIAAYTFFWAKEFSNVSLLTSSLLSTRLMMLSMGYFIADLVIGIKYGILGFDAFVHHFVVISSEAFLVAYWKFHILSISSLFTEFTTPFINNRWLLEKLGMKESKFYVLNGLIIWVGWVIFRLPFTFWIGFILYRNRFTFLNYMPFFATVFILLQSSMISYLNYLWFYKITKGIVKVLGQSLKSKKQ